MKIVWRHRGVPNLRRQISQLRRLPSPPLPLAAAAVAADPCSEGVVVSCGAVLWRL
jgi:hypothetical protein